MPADGEIKLRIELVEASLRKAEEKIQKTLDGAGKIGVAAPTTIPGGGGGAGSAVTKAPKELGALPDMLGMLTKVTVVLGIIATAAKASAVFQNAIKGILKLLEIILRPVGDVIGTVGFIFFKLMLPFVRALQQLWLPRQIKMAKALGEIKPGEPGGAGKALGVIAGETAGFLGDIGGILFGTALEGIGKLFNLAIDTMVTNTQLLILAITGLGSSLLRAIPGGQGLAEGIEQLGAGLIGAAEGVKAFAQEGITIAVNVAKDLISGVQDIQEKLREGLGSALNFVADQASKTQTSTLSMGAQLVTTIGAAGTKAGFFSENFMTRLVPALQAGSDAGKGLAKILFGTSEDKLVGAMLFTNAAAQILAGFGLKDSREAAESLTLALVGLTSGLNSVFDTIQSRLKNLSTIRSGGFAINTPGNIEAPQGIETNQGGIEAKAFARSVLPIPGGTVSGAGETTVNINVNGPVVREEQDITQIIDKVSEEVQKEMSRKTSYATRVV